MRLSIKTMLAVPLIGVILFACKPERNVTQMTESEYDATMRKKVSRLITAVSNGDASTFASLCRYPIERPYPIPDIVSVEEMIMWYPSIMDKNITRRIAETNLSDWYGFGWRGYTFGDGDLYIDDEVYLINYVSENEKCLRQTLIYDDLASLPSDLARDWLPEICLTDTLGTVYRVDVKELDAMYTDCRMLVYEKGTDLKGSPTNILFGTKKLEGSAGTRCYVFSVERQWTVCNYWFENQIFLYKNDHEDIDVQNQDYEAVELHKVYWLDLIDKPSKAH